MEAYPDELRRTSHEPQSEKIQQELDAENAPPVRR
jgi:hypothetical protein